MPFRSVLSAALLTALVLAGCTTPAATATKSADSASASAAAAPAPSRATPPQKVTYALRYERTPCMGNCPVYVAEIDVRNRLTFKGGKFAPREGEVKVTLPAEVLTNARQAAADLKFETLPADEYGHGMMDASSDILTIRRADGTAHTVTSVGGEGPEDLIRLFRYLDGQITEAVKAAK